MIVKRIFDVCVAAGGLLVFAPLFILIAVWIKFDSPGPVFFRQQRIGQYGRPFSIHKFRTMFARTRGGNSELTIGNDPRITRSGQFLRRYKLDELPQLVDVFFGRMSLVGPRPEVPKYVAVYPNEIRAIVLSVKPGITDLASIYFSRESEILAEALDPEREYVEKILPTKLDYYVRYVQTRSFGFDLMIILKTFKALLS
jgi:lipopolysaccharide/colanic/teichoic acid biosynthesis glycosyltransferase